MANDTLILAAGAAASFYLLTQKKEPVIPNTTTIDVVPANPGGPTIIDPGNTPITGINGPYIGQITATSLPNYETWTRPEWSSFLKAKAETTDLETASPIIWTAWTDTRNPFVDLFPSQNALMFDLIMDQVKNKPAVIGEVLSADSVPVYGTAWNAWSGIHYWTCDEWQLWYDLNAQKYGTQQAQIKFVDAWSHDDNQSVLTWDAAGWSCGYDCDFTNYMRTKGLDVANWGTQNTCTLVEIPSNLIDAGAAVSEGVKDTANTVSFLMPVTVIALTGIFIYSQYQKAK